MIDFTAIGPGLGAILSSNLFHLRLCLLPVLFRLLAVELFRSHSFPNWPLPPAADATVVIFLAFSRRFMTPQ
jgi:hypothetical protein